MTEKKFEWPSGSKPAVRVLLNGSIQIVDEGEHAPLITVTGHNGVDPGKFFERYTTAIRELRAAAKEARRLIGFMTNDKIGEAARVLDAALEERTSR